MPVRSDRLGAVLAADHPDVRITGCDPARAYAYRGKLYYGVTTSPAGADPRSTFDQHKAALRARLAA